MSNYPPGVTGNEPEITGEYPCTSCGGAGGWMEDTGPDICPLCKGIGIFPEDAYMLDDLKKEIKKLFENESWGNAECEEDDSGYLIIHTNFKIIGEAALYET